MENENFVLFKLLIKCLEDKTYSQLEIKQIGTKYYLVIHHQTFSKVFINRFGKRKEYTHIWQITNWLDEAFDIKKDELKIPKL
ncbi:hypothetical protein D1818_22215 [Aquimarina sp. BL5]|uniref:hypothetical protein n=1 Tax=Aquimarina sp. BL5 TaxID=1714860 RepID=UPI000E50EF82|nr:hypothetical protein [Aquimarina sp. BL5]AXT53406.1 hypothetical protein D1818_22215 [Aquimarina sp. BL5]RKN08890.1 hypothetical protein D7036_05095 [Aquimarina sp. BL5]